MPKIQEGGRVFIYCVIMKIPQGCKTWIPSSTESNWNCMWRRERMTRERRRGTRRPRGNSNIKKSLRDRVMAWSEGIVGTKMFKNEREVTTKDLWHSLWICHDVIAEPRGSHFAKWKQKLGHTRLRTSEASMSGKQLQTTPSSGMEEKGRGDAS